MGESSQHKKKGIKRTALNSHDRAANGTELRALDKSTCSALQLERHRLLAYTQDKSPCEDSAPPCLDFDRSRSHALVVLNSKAPLDVLLDEGD